MLLDDDTRYRAVAGRDPRFDGWFFTGVTSTGIYCRPSCAALTPRRSNVRFYPSAAAAQQHGFRACKRCRPDAAPGSPDWDLRADLAGRALRLIADGVVDRDGVDGLARRLGYSSRQVGRTLVGAVGAGPLALARAQRARTARTLLETTTMPATDVAFAAGFASVRQFNETVQAVFATSPRELRRTRTDRTPRPGGGVLELRLAYRSPMDVAAVLRWHGAHAVAGLESYAELPDGPVYTRTLSLPHGAGRVALCAGEPGWIRARLELRDQRDLTAAVARTRGLLDLDADPVAVDEALGTDEHLAPLVARRPGMRSPGAVDGGELALRTVVGQQVSLRSARATLAKLVASHGRPVFDDEPGWLFPAATDLAALDPQVLPMPRARGRAVVNLATQLCTGELDIDPGTDRAHARARLLAQPGIGPWTADYVVMRGLGDPDVLLDTDLAVRRVAAARGLDLADSARWSPWRSYVTHHLWAEILEGATL